MQSHPSKPLIAIACGGTGGHLFPGMAVAEQLIQRGCDISLLISPKEVDQQAVKSASGMSVATLPAVGLVRGSRLAFLKGFFQSSRAALKLFRQTKPQAVLAMGGFTSAPPILVARGMGIPTFLHESNTIPGRANRWLSRFVNEAFVGFPEASSRLKTKRSKVTGTPVRPQFVPGNTAASRAALGLNVDAPVLLVTGGSQGASGLNDLVLNALPALVKQIPNLQLIHLTGPSDAEKVEKACAALGIKAVVRPFFAEMNVALGAATACISRAGASSLAELAAMRMPSVLVPFPAATDNHQLYNALAFQKTGAACLMEQKGATSEGFIQVVTEFIQSTVAREKMQKALEQWHAPQAADKIAENIMTVVNASRIGKATEESQSPLRQNKSAIT